jgi:hypothetical protein
VRHEHQPAGRASRPGPGVQRQGVGALTAAAEREDPAATLRAVHGAVDGELWNEVPFPAMRDLLVCCAEAAWKSGITALPQEIESADAALA